MKRSDDGNSGPSRPVGWIQYIGMVLAFIGLWQILASGVAFLHHWF